MGGSLNVDTLIRNLITTVKERLNIAGVVILIYNDKTDLVSVKDLIGLSPELFAKFRFYSDHQILIKVFDESGYWKPEDQDLNLMVGEFETDEVRSLRLLVPMRIKDNFVGVIALGSKNDKSEYTEAEVQLIQALTGVASTSINNAMLFENS